MTITKNKIINYSLKLGTISIAGLLFILPFTEINTLKDILISIAILSFLLTSILNRYHKISISSPDKSLNILIIISFFWGFIALINATNPAYSLNELLHKMSKQYILYFVSFYIAKESSSNTEKIKILFYPLIFLAIIMSSYACFQFFQSPVIWYNRATGFTGAFYRLAVFLVISIPIITALALTMSNRLKLFFLLIISLLLAALVFTFVRAAWIAVIIEMSILIVIFFKKYRKSFLTGITVISLIFVIVSYNSPLYKKLIVHGSEMQRLKAITLSMEIIRKYPVTGIGYGKKTFYNYHPSAYEVKHAHNIFLNTAVELGITGLIIFVSMLVIVAKDFIKAIKIETVYDRKLILSGIFASITGFLTLNMFDYMYHGWPGQMFWMLIGIGYAFIQTHPNLKDGVIIDSGK